MEDLEKKVWQVWRTDDNSNEFMIDSNLTKAQADKMAKDYEKKGHNQLYEVRKKKDTT